MKMGLGGLAFVAMSLAIAIMSLFSRGDFKWFLIAFFGFATFFFGLSSVWHVRSAQDKRPGLSLDAKNIQHSTVPFSVDRVIWSEVREFLLYEDRGARRLVVSLKNPSKVLRRYPVPQRLLIVGLTCVWLKSPMVIHSALVGRNLRDVFEELSERLEEHKRT